MISADELHFVTMSVPSPLNMQVPSQYTVRPPYPTTPGLRGARSSLRSSTDTREFGVMEDAGRTNPHGSPAAVSDLAVSAKDSPPRPRPHWYISRGGGTLTSLIPADELPHSICIQGAPRQFSASQIQDMCYVGHMPHNGVLYELEQDLAPTTASTHMKLSHNCGTSESGRIAPSQRNAGLRELAEGHDWNVKPRKRNSWDMDRLQGKFNDATAAGERQVGLPSFLASHPILTH